MFYWMWLHFTYDKVMMLYRAVQSSWIIHEYTHYRSSLLLTHKRIIIKIQLHSFSPVFYFYFYFLLFFLHSRNLTIWRHFTNKKKVFLRLYSIFIVDLYGSMAVKIKKICFCLFFIYLHRLKAVGFVFRVKLCGVE